MAFIVRKGADPRNYKKVTISSITVTFGELLENVGGATTWTEPTATSNHFTRKAIAQEATSTSETSVLVYELDGTEDVEALATNTANAAHNGDLMVLTDSNTVNNTGTTSSTEYACFVQDKVGLDTTHIIGRVLVGDGVNPDATT